MNLQSKYSDLILNLLVALAVQRAHPRGRGAGQAGIPLLAA